MNRDGKIRRALNAYGGYRTHKTTEFDTHVNALPPMPLHPPDDTGEFEAERIRPAQTPNIEADGCVPGLWAFVFASCAGVFWLWGWLFFEWPWFYVIPIFVTVFTIAFYLSIGAIQKTLWTIERIFHVDLDQDGAVGPPTTAMEINIRNDKGTLEKQFRGRFSIGDDRLRTFARGALIGKALTLSTWAGSGKLFTRPEFEGVSIYGITQRLNDMGIETPSQRGRSKRKSRQAGKWSTTTVSGILKRKTYIGVWRYGKTKVIKGQQKRIKTNSDLTVAVPEIIERDIWKAAQVKLSENREKAKRNRKYEYLLSGRCVCGKCGRKMGGRSRKEYKAKNLKHYLYYYCTSPDCEMTYFRAKPVEHAVWEWLIGIFMDDERLENGIEAYLEAINQQNNPIEQELEIVNNLLFQHKADLDNALLDLKATKSPRAKARIADDLVRLEKQLDGLEKRKQELQNQLEAVNLTADQRISIQEFAARVRTDLATIEDDFESKRELLDLLNLQITLDIVEYKRRGFVTCKIGRLENLPITYTLSKSDFQCIRVA